MQIKSPQVSPSHQNVMAGFPHPPEKRVTLENAYRPEHLAWRTQNFTRVFPCARISRGTQQISVLTPGDSFKPENVEVKDPQGQALKLEDVLLKTSVDSMLIMHRGKVVYEGYYGDMDVSKVHAMYSCTKSVMGLLVETLIHNGVLNEEKPASFYVPELSSSAAGTATVRELLDMRANFVFLGKPKVAGQVQADYIRALGFISRPADYAGPNGVYEVLQSATPMGAHGGMFRYDNGSTDTLGWILRRASGQALDQLISEMLWSRLGAERDASISIDAVGAEWAAAGMGATLRDFARLGEMIRCRGAVNGQQILPEAVYRSIQQGGDPNFFANDNGLTGGSYRSQFWFYHDRHDSFGCRGQYGQRLWIAPKAEILVAQFSVDPFLAELEPLRLSGFQAIADALVLR